jgi:hypothetical protein
LLADKAGSVGLDEISLSLNVKKKKRWTTAPTSSLSSGVRTGAHKRWGSPPPGLYKDQDSAAGYVRSQNPRPRKHQEIYNTLPTKPGS